MFKTIRPCIETRVGHALLIRFLGPVWLYERGPLARLFPTEAKSGLSGCSDEEPLRERERERERFKSLKSDKNL